MIKLRWISATFLLIIIFVSCSKDISSNNAFDIYSSTYNILNNDNLKENNYSFIKSDSTFSDKIQITFVTDFSNRVDTEIINELNMKLDKDGYNFVVNFINLNADKICPIDYYENCIKTKMTDIDILMTSGGVSSEIINSAPEIYTCSPHENTYWECVNKGYFIELNSYFKTNSGKRLYDVFNERYWSKAMDNEGKIYGLYTSYFTDRPTALSFNKKVAKKYNFDIYKFDGKLYSLERVLQSIKIENGSAGLQYSDLKEDCCNIVGFSRLFNGIYINEKNGLAENIFENIDFIKYSKQMSDFQKKGYLVNINDAEENNETLCVLSNYMPLYYDESFTDFIISNAYQLNDSLNCGIGILSSSQHKNEAFELLSLLYSNKEYANLMICGVEDINYTLNNDNVAVLNNDKPSFYADYDYFSVPANPFITMPVVTNEGRDYLNKNELFYQMYNHIELSCAVGIDFDYSRISEKLEKIKNIYDKYKGLFFGEFSNVTTTLEQANNELKSVGLDEVLNDINRQLEKYYEKNNR